MKPIKQICDEFLSRPDLKYSAFPITMQRQLLSSFVKHYASYKFDSKYLPDAIKDAVKSYTRDKDRAIKFFQEFTDYLNKEPATKMNIILSVPPIPVYKAFERTMYIAKAIQDPSGESQKTVEALSDLLWVSEETIRDDIDKLRGLTEESITFMDQALIVPDIVRGKGKITYDSTVHPIFIAGNLTQILILLRGLREMCQNQLFSSYGLPLASSIWHQLSDYARQRIITVSKEILFDPEVSWFSKLDTVKNGTLYHNEAACSPNQGPMAILRCAKNHMPCDIEYLSPGGEPKNYYNVLIKDSRKNNTWTIVYNNEDVILLESGITNVTVSERK